MSIVMSPLTHGLFRSVLLHFQTLWGFSNYLSVVNPLFNCAVVREHIVLWFQPFEICWDLLEGPAQGLFWWTFHGSIHPSPAWLPLVPYVSAFIPCLLLSLADVLCLYPVCTCSECFTPPCSQVLPSRSRSFLPPGELARAPGVQSFRFQLPSAFVWRHVCLAFISEGSLLQQG